MAQTQPSDYIELTLPTRLSAEQRSRMIAAHSRLLAILNSPDSAKAQKAGARRAMQALRKQISMLGGRVDTHSSAYQFDPTTSEITGIIGGTQPQAPVAPAKVKSIQTQTGHQIRVPLFIEKPVSKQKVLEAFPQAALKPGETRPAAGTAPAMAPGVTDPTTGLRIQPAQRIEPAAAAIPQTSTVAPVATQAAKPTVPPLTEDLNADPTLAALAPPPAASQPPATVAPAESPEMTRLRALLAQPEPPPPDTGLTPGQKAAYGFLVGLKPEAAGGVAQIISGQRADAVQRDTLARQQRETTVNNLIRLVSLQQEQEARQAALGLKQQSLLTDARSAAGAVKNLDETIPSVIQTAIAHIDAITDKGRSTDPTAINRANDIVGKLQAVRAVQQSINDNLKTDPLSVDAGQIAFYKSRVDDLNASIEKSMSEEIKRVEDTKLPDSATLQIATLKSSAAGGRLALAMVREGIGGPVETWTLEHGGALVAPERAQQVAVLQSLLHRVSAETARGSTGRLAEFETEVFPYIFLDAHTLRPILEGQLNEIIAWADAKSAMISGQPGAQTEAERHLALAAGWVVVAHTGEGYPVWQSPQGIRYTEAPEVP